MENKEEGSEWKGLPEERDIGQEDKKVEEGQDMQNKGIHVEQEVDKEEGLQELGDKMMKNKRKEGQIEKWTQRKRMGIVNARASWTQRRDGGGQNEGG